MVYCSALRHLGELDLSERLAQQSDSLPPFVSCDNGRTRENLSRVPTWCTRCAKCYFVYLALAPYVARSALVDFFGRDVLAEPADGKAVERRSLAWEAHRAALRDGGAGVRRCGGACDPSRASTAPRTLAPTCPFVTRHRDHGHHEHHEHHGQVDNGEPGRDPDCRCRSFRGSGADLVGHVVHRFTLPPGHLEEIPTADGIRWVNDPLASNPLAASAALRTCDGTPVVMILGGESRGVGPAPLLEALNSHGEAVQVAAEIARSGDAVLFSSGAPTPKVLGTGKTGGPGEWISARVSTRGRSTAGCGHDRRHTGRDHQQRQGDCG